MKALPFCWEIIRQRMIGDSLDMDQYGCCGLRITRSGRADFNSCIESRCGGPEPPCQNGNTQEQRTASRSISYADDHAYEAARRGTRVAPSSTDASNRTSSPPLRYSVSRAVPGQSRRHAVRSSLDPLSRGPLLRERIPMPSGILILWLRCKIGWRSRQYCEGPWEGFPSAPKVWRPLDVSNLPERSLRSSQ